MIVSAKPHQDHYCDFTRYPKSCLGYADEPRSYKL